MLVVKGLHIGFRRNDTVHEVLKNVSFQLERNQILGVVGESGSGKSLASLSLIGLLPENAVTEGEILFQGVDLLKLKQKNLRKIRGNKIGMIFQEPMSSLNPTMTCGEQIAEVLKHHDTLKKIPIKEHVISLFEKVKLPRPQDIFTSYPHQISGGQKQRVMIAMAIACQPDILIADEPTTALDVTVQREIITLLKELQSEIKMGILFISHDLSLVSEIADTVIVLRKGVLVEEGTATSIFKNPQKEYTKALINAKPRLDQRLKLLPTVKDFTNHEMSLSEYTTEERTQFHQKL